MNSDQLHTNFLPTESERKILFQANPENLEETLHFFNEESEKVRQHFEPDVFEIKSAQFRSHIYQLANREQAAYHENLKIISLLTATNSSTIYFLAVLSTIKYLRKNQKLEEALDYCHLALDQIHLSNFTFSLPILSEYVFLLIDLDKSFEWKYEPIILQISEEIGLETIKKGPAETVCWMYAENKLWNKKFAAIQLMKGSQEKRSQALEDFESHCPITFYRDLANQLITQIKTGRPE